MRASTDPTHSGPRGGTSRGHRCHPGVKLPQTIAVGVGDCPGGLDAVALAAALGRVSDAELMLVSVHPDPVVVLPGDMNWHSVHQQAAARLHEVRDSLAPDARTVVETDLSVCRALERVVRREHRDLLVVGSSRQAGDGRVRIGKRTRQLLSQFRCALAVAPRGMHDRSEFRFARIGVGYDGGPESGAAVAIAAGLASAAGAELHIRGVVDDRPPAIGWSSLAAGGAAVPLWGELIDEEIEAFGKRVRRVAYGAGADVTAAVVRGRPADALLALSSEVDLLVIGSRRWGPTARVLLGATGEALLHNAACAVLTVPRPPNLR